MRTNCESTGEVVLNSARMNESSNCEERPDGYLAPLCAPLFFSFTLVPGGALPSVFQHEIETLAPSIESGASPNGSGVKAAAFLSARTPQEEAETSRSRTR